MNAEISLDACGKGEKVWKRATEREEHRSVALFRLL
jgi:hypothetical protein